MNRLIIMKAFIYFAFVFLFGCQSVNDGDWYEHKGTRERVQIFLTGKGWSMRRSISPLVDIENNTSKKKMSRLNYEAADSLKQCCVFRTFMRVHEGLVFTPKTGIPGLDFLTYNIVPVDNFLVNYSKVN